MNGALPFGKQSREHYERLLCGAERSRRADELDVDRFLASLREDEQVLGAFLEEVRILAHRDGLEAELDAAADSCIEIRVGGKLGASLALLRLGEGGKARMLLAELMGQDEDRIPARHRVELLHALISACWRAKDWDQVAQQLRWARRLDEDNRYGSYLSGMERLLAAKRSYLDGDFAAVVRQCRALIEDTDPQDGLQTPALELLADGFGGLGDAAREWETLQQWANRFADEADGPCTEAMRAEVEGPRPGVVDELRRNEILCHYSRLALYAERRGDQKAAMTMFAHFENVGFHDWRDPMVMGLGTIRQRRARLEHRQKDGVDTSPPLVLLEPTVQYSKVCAESLDDALKVLRSLAPGWQGAVRLHEPALRENRFEFDPELGDPLRQLGEALSAFSSIPDGIKPFWCPRRTEVHRAECVEDWLLLTGEGPPDLCEHLGLLVSARPLGMLFEIRMLAVLFWNSDQPHRAEELSKLLNGRPEQWEGYQTLAAQWLVLVKRACGRVSQQRTAIGRSEGDRPGGLRKL